MVEDKQEMEEALRLLTEARTELFFLSAAFGPSTEEKLGDARHEILRGAEGLRDRIHKFIVKHRSKEW